MKAYRPGSAGLALPRTENTSAASHQVVAYLAPHYASNRSGELHDRMPLPADVGEAIVDYIKNGWAGNSRTLFVSATTPHPPFKNAQILNTLLCGAFERTGLKPPQKYVGSHLLRHSLATDMLRKRASLDEIGDVLRQRARMTTTIYAKYDIDALRSIARTWPVGGDAR